MEDERKNCCIIDWLTFSHKMLTAEEVIAILGLSGEKWEKDDHSNLRYEKRMSFMHITVHYTETDYKYMDQIPKNIYNPGVCVEISGSGCREFEEFSEVSWCDLLTWINDQSQNTCIAGLSSCGSVDVVMRSDFPLTVQVAQISRLDLAYDDFEGVLDINTLAQHTRDFSYTTILKKHRIIEDAETQDPDHVGLSVCFGSRSSPVYFRFYDKRIERGRFDIPHWIRAEIQLRSSAAQGALSCLCSGMPCGELHANICNRYIQFKEKSLTDTHKDRWNAAQWWLDFLGSVSEVCLFARKDVEYNKPRMDRYAYQQNHNHTLCELACDGVDGFLLHLLQYRDEIPEKYCKVAQMQSRDGVELAELLRSFPHMSKQDYLLFFADQLRDAAAAAAESDEYRRIFHYIDP